MPVQLMFLNIYIDGCEKDKKFKKNGVVFQVFGKKLKSNLRFVYLSSIVISY